MVATRGGCCEPPANKGRGERFPLARAGQHRYSERLVGPRREPTDPAQNERRRTDVAVHRDPEGRPRHRARCGRRSSCLDHRPRRSTGHPSCDHRRRPDMAWADPRRPTEPPAGIDGAPNGSPAPRAGDRRRTGRGQDRVRRLPPHPNGNRQRIVRFDSTTSAIDSSRPISGGQGGVDRLAMAGGSLWASTGSLSAGTGRILYRLDARTLDVRDRLRMPGPTGPLAAVPAGLWAAAGRGVVLIDPETGKTIRTVAFAGRAELIVADPSGQRLYVSTAPPSGTTPHRSSSSTRRRARSWREPGGAAPTSTARAGCPPRPTASG